MNLELLAHLNQEHLEGLHREARDRRIARAALRLPRTARSAAVERPVQPLPVNGVHDCCVVAS